MGFLFVFATLFAAVCAQSDVRVLTDANFEHDTQVLACVCCGRVWLGVLSGE
jgi:hypothetical protein